jgi:putative membrane protein
MFYPHEYMMFPFFGLSGFIGHVLGWIVFVFIILWLVKAVSHGKHHRWMHMDSAMDILRERYAKGEITKEQFESMKKDLQ